MKPIKVFIFGRSSGFNPVSLSNQTVSKHGGGVSPLTVTYTVGSDGNLYNQDGSNIGVWLSSGSSLNYQVQAVIVSGSPTSGTFNAWLGCSGSQNWSLTVVAGDSETCSFSVSIRDAAVPNTVRATATITLTGSNA